MNIINNYELRFSFPVRFQVRAYRISRSQSPLDSTLAGVGEGKDAIATKYGWTILVIAIK